MFFAAPVLVLGASVGALIGVKPRTRSGRATSGPAPTKRRAVIVITARAAAELALWTMLGATGVVDASPVGFG